MREKKQNEDWQQRVYPEEKRTALYVMGLYTECDPSDFFRRAEDWNDRDALKHVEEND